LNVVGTLYYKVLINALVPDISDEKSNIFLSLFNVYNASAKFVNYVSCEDNVESYYVFLVFIVVI